ncbi:MAG: ATP-binding protein, partial [Acidobacteriota bacterium]|nr:ATP-binding protein [Acidobacteriota bacterium]
ETYPVPGASGRVGAVVEIGRVVTDEKRLQMQMVYQEKMAAFGQLAAGLAHEIGNPLASIESQLQMAQRHPDRLRDTVEVVGKQVERMGRMLRRLVDFSRRRRVDESLVSTGQVVDDVAQLLEHDPRARRVTIERAIEEDLPGIRTKEDELAQVLMNLGINALDAIGGAGRLVFAASARDGVVEIRVQDDGHGVPDSARERIFDPFFTTKAAGRGTGLGLFVSKGIIEEIGGELRLERTGSDGTVFVIQLASEHHARSTP